jgi:transposase
LAGLVVEHVDALDDVVVITGRSRAEGSYCPACGSWSVRVHGRYQRLLVDDGVDGRGVRVRLTVRRFRCLSPQCSTVTFAERFEGLTRPHARFTEAVEPVLSFRQPEAAVQSAGVAGFVGSRAG